jgi:hypothetical protein
MSKVQDPYEAQKRKLEEETNSFNITPISFEVFKKTPEEKKALKAFQEDWKKSKK